jgi:hypothetical protein
MSIASTSIRPERERQRSRWLIAAAAFVLGGSTAALLYHVDVFGGSTRSTSEGSGSSVTQARRVAPFTSVELAGSNNVLIRVGDKQSVVVRADDNLIDRVTTDVRSSKLVIANTPGDFSTTSPMSVQISVPTLDGLTLTGSGNIVVRGIRAGSLAVALPGSGTLTASGTARRLAVTVGGSGSVQFTRLVATTAKAVVSGSGTIFVTATTSLDALVSGTGSILYTGTPRHVTKNVTGTGAITGT